MIKKPLVNNQIRAQRVRLIDDAGNQVGIISLQEALQMAKERNLDLIQVTERVEPPVCKIMDYGKYLYRLQKKEKGSKKSTAVKGLRLRFNISPHDLETRILQAEKFLKKGNKVKVEMVLRGREKRLSRVAVEKLKTFITSLREKIEVRTEGEIKKKSNGFIVVISSSHQE